MTYRLTKPELRIIEQTKLEGERLEREKEAGAETSTQDTVAGEGGSYDNAAGLGPKDREGNDKRSDLAGTSPESTAKQRSIITILKPYLFFLALMLGIVIAIAVLIFLTS